MFKFIHHLLNPHCPECRAEALEKQARLDSIKDRELDEMHEAQKCESCGTLRRQLELANHQIELLMDKILKEPKTPKDEKPVEISRSRAGIPWNARRQLLESEDRKRAELMAKAAKPVTQTTEELEKELEVEPAHANQ